MALAQEIPVRYAEEDAGYVSVRPVVKQLFRLSELADLVVSVAGKDAARVQQIFGAGTVVYNGYRYWWDGLAADIRDIQGLLLPFPDDDPSRPFEPAKATAVLLEIGGGTQRSIIAITAKDAAEKKWFGKWSAWDVLVKFAARETPRYEKYSHARRADLFRIAVPYGLAQELLAEMLVVAPRGLRHHLGALRPPAAVTFVIPRK